MAIFKITLNVIGENLIPDNIISKLNGNAEIESYAKGDKVSLKKSTRRYKLGGIFISNPQNFGRQHEGDIYEEWYVDFIEKNYDLFIKYGAEVINLYIEVYTIQHDQCNFEIFSKSMLKRLCKYDVSLPISVYVLTEEEFKGLIT